VRRTCFFGARTGWKYGDQKAVDAMIHDGLWCAFEGWHMGEAAEHIAAKCGVSRAEQDRLSPRRVNSVPQRRGEELFEKEIVPVTVGTGSKSQNTQQRRGNQAGHDGRGAGETETGVPRGRHVTAGNASIDADERCAGGASWQRALSPSDLGTKPLARIVA